MMNTIKFMFMVLLCMASGSVCAVSYQKIIGEDGPAVQINGESPVYWGTVYRSYSGTQCRTNLYCTSQTWYSNAIKTWGISNGQPVISLFFNLSRNSLGQITGFSEYRDYPLTGHGYAITITGATFNTVGHVTDFQYSTSVETCPPYIVGRVTLNGNGMDGVDVQFSNNGGTVSTFCGGYYVYAATGWSGVVLPVKAGYSFSPASRSYSNPASSQLNQDFAATVLPTFSISGSVTDSNGNGIPDVTMSGLPGNPKTNSSGFYTATVYQGWSGTATPTKSGYGFTPPSRPYSNITSNQTAQDYSGNISYTISGYVRTSTSAGIPDVEMVGLPGNPKTDNSGYYSAKVNEGWSGTVTPTKPGYVFSPLLRTHSDIRANQTSQNYSGVISYTISGTVRDTDGKGISGAVMNGLPGSPTTDSLGYYIVSVSDGWSGTVTPKKSGFNFDPASRTYSNVKIDQTVQDYLVFVTNFNEFTLLSQYWLMTGCGQDQPCGDADWYADGTIDLLDLNQLAMSWLGEMIYYIPEMKDGFETGSFSAIPWQFSGNGNWTVVSTDAFAGTYAAKSGSITDSQASDLILTADAANFDTISFARKVSSESGYDYLRFYIDGTEKEKWSGTQNWTTVTFSVTPGQHTFKWSYTKDNIVSSGSDCAWIDDVRLYQAP